MQHVHIELFLAAAGSLHVALPGNVRNSYFLHNSIPRYTPFFTHGQCPHEELISNENTDRRAHDKRT